MTPDQRALRDAFLAELWPVCREVPRDVRAEQRKADREMRQAAEEMAVAQSSTVVPPLAEAI